MALSFKGAGRLALSVALGALVSVSFAQETTSSKQPAVSGQRIVSLNGSNTELLFALGLGDQVVARDDSATYPPAVHNIPSVGYQFRLNAEGILSMKPTIVVGRDDVKPPVVTEQIKATGVRVELLKEPASLAEAEQRITKLGALFNKQDEAAGLVEELASDTKKFEARKAELGDKVKKKAVFLYLRGPKVTFVLGNQSSVAGMLDMVGVENVMGQVGQSAPITAEALIAAQPEVIITFLHGMESLGGMEGVLKLPGIAETPAGRNKRVIAMDDSYLGGLTNRAGKAALDLLNAMQAEGPVTVNSPK